MGIRVIPGIGPKSEAELHERGVRTVRDLRGLELAQLAEWFGRWGEDLHAKARGLSDSPVSNEWEPKSRRRAGDVRGEHARGGVHPGARAQPGPRGLRTARAPGLPRLPHRHHHRPLRALPDATRSHTPAGADQRPRTALYAGRRPPVPAVPRPAGESASSEDPAHRGEGREAPEVTGLVGYTTTPMTSEGPKSAYELAMERLRQQDREAGVEERPLTEAQKTGSPRRGRLPGADGRARDPASGQDAEGPGRRTRYLQTKPRTRPHRPRWPRPRPPTGSPPRSSRRRRKPAPDARPATGTISGSFRS